jgi:hypothetical protein
MRSRKESAVPSGRYRGAFFLGGFSWPKVAANFNIAEAVTTSLAVSLLPI